MFDIKVCKIEKKKKKEYFNVTINLMRPNASPQPQFKTLLMTIQSP